MYRSAVVADDRKRKYFARMRGSRISVFCAVYSISLADLWLSLRLASNRRPDGYV